MEPPADPWLLTELPDISAAVGYPLQCTQRIKYTCFDVSKSLLIFGATSGGLYVFNREPCSFVQLIPNKEGSILKIKISPQEKCVAFATHKGIVCVCDCGIDIGTYMKSPVLQISREHQGNEITHMIWNQNGNELYIGDDTGIVSVLHVSKSFAKNVFQTPASALMHLDSRIVQIDIKESKLLVSTLSRCFICDTTKEQYAQIGQKLRDGEYGACFFFYNTDQVSSEDSSPSHEAKTNGTYSILSEQDQINSFDKFGYLKIFCARPGSRLWEVKINGIVLCTHQFKQLLAMPPTDVISSNNFETEDFSIDQESKTYEPQSVCFTKLSMFKHRFIFTFTKDAIYILDPKDPSVVLWCDRYDDIIDCKIISDFIYIWRANGNVTILSFNSVEKLLLKCFINQKFKLCAKICSLYASSIIDSIPKYKKIHLISELGSKLRESGELELFDKISPVLDEIIKVRKEFMQKPKIGIVVVENSYLTKDFDTDSCPETESPSKNSLDDNDSMLFQISPDPIQVIKDFGSTVSDKLTLGTKTLKKTWDHLENKMKRISMDKNYNEPLDVATFSVNKTSDIIKMNSEDNNIIEKSPSSNKLTFEDDTPKVNRTIEQILSHIKLKDFNEIDYCETIHPILADISCDINIIYQTIKEVEEYMISLGSSSSYAAYHCGKVLLHHITKNDIDKTINAVIENEELCSYFLRAFIVINTKSSCACSCECGYPLPNTNSSQTPLFTDLINVFIEKKWESSQSEQCYDICKKVPYMWRKILLLRKNEDLLNILLLILQILDEELLYMYLPQFTVKTWEKAIKLLATLKRNECLNCGKQFSDKGHKLRNKLIIGWDSIGALVIKSVGCKNATAILKTFSDLIPAHELSLKFYHSCLFVKLFEKYDSTVSINLLDAIYQAYDYEDAVMEMSLHLKECLQNGLLHTALPLSVASKSSHWGLKVTQPITTNSSLEEDEHSNQPDLISNMWLNFDGITLSTKKAKPSYQIGMNLEQTLEHIEDLCPNKDCHHCCLPLTSRVLVAEAGLWSFSCGHTFHGVCLRVLKVKLCPLCFKIM